MENNVAERLERRSRQWIEIYRSTLQAESDRLAAKLSQVDEDLAEIETQARAVAGDFLQLSALKARIAEKQKGIDDVLAKLSEINVVSTNFTETRTTVIDEPGIGLRVAPSLLKYLAIGIFVGGILGVGLAVLIDRSDLTYRNPGEVFERLKAPVVCKIPAARVPRRANGKAANPALIALYSPSSKLAEAIRAARTALLFAAKSQGSKVFLMTSPSPGDGKSTVTANLAISLAQSGKRVVLVDADFRRPRVHAYFDVPLEPGIMQAVSADEHLDNCLRPSSQDGLTLLSAGGRPKNPGEVVTSQEFGQLMEQLRERFDIVIIDSPPLLPVADAAVISALVDGVYMVIRIRKGVVVTSSKAKEKLDMVDAQCLGVIVNGLDDNPHYNEYGSYAYGFGSNYNVGNGSYYETRNSRYQERLEAP
jgi:capsular exopolysaccharide synthesis family protein